MCIKYSLKGAVSKWRATTVLDFLNNHIGHHLSLIDEDYMDDEKVEALQDLSYGFEWSECELDDFSPSIYCDED
jgi:hypothetical protein